MTTYVVPFTNSTKTPISITEQSVDNSTDVTLFGRSELAYGAQMNQNMLSLLEKFACPESIQFPGTPDLTKSNGKLINPVVGQIWYNSTQKIPFFWTGLIWSSMLSGGSIASNWGIITNGQQIPQPIDDNGNAFPYTECVWIVGPFTIDGEVTTDYTIETNANAVVTATLNVNDSGFALSKSLVVNYLIVGIKGNVNRGSLNPIQTPTPTPTISITPSVTPQAINLNNGLISFWEFEDNVTNTFFLDSAGTNNWLRTGVQPTALSAPSGCNFNPTNPLLGKVGQAIQGGSSTIFTSNPTLGMAAGAGAQYTFGGWFQMNSNFVSFSNIFQRGLFSTNGQRSFTLTYTLSTDSLSLYKSQDGTSYEFLSTAANIGLKDFKWHFIVAWIDGVNLTLNIQVDNGTIYSTPMLFNTTFNIGNLNLGSSAGVPLQAAVDQLFYYNRLLNTSERAALWNAGCGVTYAYVSGQLPPTPTPSLTPSNTPFPTPTLTALTTTLSTYSASGQSSCLGAGCNAATNSVSGITSGGTMPYSFQWVHVAGVQFVVTNPTSSTTSFNNSVSGQTACNMIGYYRLKVTDVAGTVVYSPLLEVNINVIPGIGGC